ncbi:MAG: penicillin-binding protein 1C [Saprospiraceae bacterium]|nr:penicillin-binding protein 1C [Saprospiraceae bacterium]HMX87818.1 penicillin-binding protein 1C [Saprospiraceae bacterium]HMZ39394.1 penicillin-binding protein 1C [Saprospiraceae bacterium]HNB30130.1 penicillin-binding protein 1C [Saprospiraceae bacterium]HNC36671.1 penicillin-binding protein 1C [Saprospiraceae bacterium]
MTLKSKLFVLLVMTILFCWLTGILWVVLDKKVYNYSPVLYGRNGQVLAVKVARDGQWRFSQDDKIPDKYRTCLLTFEDNNFFNHLGVDPVSLLRAVILNIKNRRIVSGGSTITMQLARLMLHSPERNIFNKCREIIYAVGLESRYSKKQILNLYASIAPYGMNISGIEAGMFRYYNKRLGDLTWAEAAMLAVLPNQPSWIHVNRNRNRLESKRNELLKRLFLKGVIDHDELELSLLEPLPGKPDKVQRLAPHLLDYLCTLYPRQSKFYTNIDESLQRRVIEISASHQELLRQNDIHNLGVLVVDNVNGQVLAYEGNLIRDSLRAPNDEVDMIQARRSSGSILKPLLVASAMERGMICNSSLLPDVPVMINGFRPENFSRNYSGACTVGELIHYSLNIPSVLLLKDYGIPDFHEQLRKLGFKTLFREPEDYGLSLILGGAEIRMWDLVSTYSFLCNANMLYHNNHSYLSRDDYHLRILRSDSVTFSNLKKEVQVFSAGSIYKMFEAMRNNLGDIMTSGSEERPLMAWKTGTSFGYKDAWAIGVTPSYTVCAWVGNASGLSRPGLIGIETAAPLMSDIMRDLPQHDEWRIPYDDLISRPVCSYSGFTPGPYCDLTDTIWVTRGGENLKPCPYHQQILTDRSGTNRVYADCDPDALAVNYFVLPPLMAHYYKLRHPDYKEVPATTSICEGSVISGNDEMDFIYPNSRTSVIVPVDLDEQRNIVVFKAVHKDPNATLMWFIDDQFLASTIKTHELRSSPEPGKHVLTITDQKGQRRMVSFEVVR